MPKPKIIAQQLIDESSLQEFTTQVEAALADGWQPLGDVRQIQLVECDEEWDECNLVYYYQTFVKYEQKNKQYVSTYSTTKDNECPKCMGTGLVRELYSSNRSSCTVCGGTGVNDKKETNK